MARKKPYTAKKLILDLVLTLLTGGFWLIVVIFWELYMHN